MSWCPLSPRELEIIRLRARGLGIKSVASRLGISIHTVKEHAQRTQSKLAARSITEAIDHLRRLERQSEIDQAIACLQALKSENGQARKGICFWLVVSASDLKGTV